MGLELDQFVIITTGRSLHLYLNILQINPYLLLVLALDSLQIPLNPSVDHIQVLTFKRHHAVPTKEWIVLPELGSLDRRLVQLHEVSPRDQILANHVTLQVADLFVLVWIVLVFRG